MPISVGQSYHEGGKLKATVDRVNKTFSECTIIVADSLQRHNIVSENVSYIEAYNKSIKAGDEWLTRNESILAGLTVKSNIMRWDDFFKDKYYKKYKDMIDKLQNTNIEFNNSLIETAKLFIEKYKKNITLKSSIEYLKEEAAVFGILIKYFDGYQVYPRQTQDCMKYVFDYCLANYKDRIKLVSINFSKR